MPARPRENVDAFATPLAADIDDFIAQPVGRAVLDSAWLYYCPHSTFGAFVMWGLPQPADVARLRRVLEGLLGPQLPRHVALADTRRVEHMTPQAFAVLAAYVEESRPQLAQKIERVGIVRPDGFLGAAAAGFFDMVRAPYPVEVFGTTREAVEWLNQSLAHVDEIEALYRRAANTPGVLHALHVALATSLGAAELGSAARALGVSPRALQRQLRAAGTSFRAELQLAQVRAAEKLLIETDQPVTAVAYAVGCASPAHFSDLFRRIRGETPSGWRARRMQATDDPQ